MPLDLGFQRLPAIKPRGMYSVFETKIHVESEDDDTKTRVPNYDALQDKST
jgi:hypothetical protein